MALPGNHTPFLAPHLKVAGRLRHSARRAASILVLLLAAWSVLQGCDGDGPMSPGQGALLQDLHVVSGNGQVGRPGERLSRPLKVQAVDGRGRPMVGVAIRFAVDEGNGVVSVSAAETGANGEAQTFLTLGPRAGTNRVSASAPALAGLPPTFTARAEGPETDGPAPGPSPISSGAPASLTLTAADTLLTADGEATTLITVTVLDSAGAGVPNAAVIFLASAGALETSLLTGPAGRATAVYRTPVNLSDVSEATVEARSGVLSAAVLIHLQGVRLSLTAGPDTIAVDGISRSTLRAVVERTDGSPVSNATVFFETTLGVLSASSAETDRSGTATVILTAASEAGDAVVTAFYGQGVSERTSIAFVKGEPGSIVLVKADPASISVRGSGANETTVVTFDVRDEMGRSVADGEPVFFRLDVPNGSDERVQPSETAAIGGRVQAAVSSGRVARTLRLVASAVTSSGDTVRSTPVPIAIHAGLPDEAHFSIALEPVNVAGRVLFGLTSSVTAFVFDKYSNPVPPGTSVRFRTDGGGIEGAAETDAVGQAGVRLFTAAPVPPGPGYLATITGQTVDEAGREIEATNTVLFSGPTAPISLTGPGAQALLVGTVVIPDAGSTILTFTVSDVTGLPIMGGSAITVESDVAGVKGDASIEMPDVRSGHTDYAVTLSDPVPGEDPPEAPARGSVLIRVRSVNGDRQLSFPISVD